MDPKNDIITALMSKANFDISGFSPDLRRFIYNEVANDRFPLGQIIKRAQSNENDVAALDIEFKRIKDTLPEAVEALPWELKMMIGPLLNMIGK